VEKKKLLGFTTTKLYRSDSALTVSRSITAFTPLPPSG